MGIRGGKQHAALLLWEEPERNDETDTEDQRGRDPELVALRDEQMLYWYEFMARDGKLSYRWIVQELVRLFYLSASTIGQKIADNGDVIRRMKTERLSADALRKKYPDPIRR